MRFGLEPRRHSDDKRRMTARDSSGGGSRGIVSGNRCAGHVRGTCATRDTRAARDTRGGAGHRRRDRNRADSYRETHTQKNIKKRVHAICVKRSSVRLCVCVFVWRVRARA